MLGRMPNHLDWKMLTMRWVKAEDIIPRWYKEGYRADALIVDPPRTGFR